MILPTKKRREEKIENVLPLIMILLTKRREEKIENGRVLLRRGKGTMINHGKHSSKSAYLLILSYFNIYLYC